MCWTLAEMIWIKIQGEECKMKCYADDIVLAIKQPQRSVRQLMKIIKHGGYKTKFKTEIITRYLKNKGLWGWEGEDTGLR